MNSPGIEALRVFLLAVGAVWLVCGLIACLIALKILPGRFTDTIKTVLIGTGGAALFSILNFVVGILPQDRIFTTMSGFVGAAVALAAYSVLTKPKISPASQETVKMFISPTHPGEIYRPTSESLLPTMPPQNIPLQPTQAFNQHVFQIKVCPTCKRTYTDISLSFCLEDGVSLSNVVNVQSNHDPEETVLSPKRF